MIKLLPLLFLVLVCACDNDTSTPSMNESQPGDVHANATDTLPVGGTAVAINGCYEMTMKRDTAYLELNLEDSTITGNLQYNWYERDSNTGTLKGVLRDTLIYADYTFQSEGLTSVREVIFKLVNGNLHQAMGNLTEKDGKIIFIDPANLQFQAANPFIKVDCK